MFLRSPRYPVHGRSSSLGNQGGFVLVAILMLIALSLVLIVTTSSISQMERKAVSNSTKEEIAKRNALFALEVALAQLQKEAGPDQRITATADILNTNTNVAQPFWTGVWKTFNPAWTNDPARQPWYRPQPLDIQMSGQQAPILRDWSTNATNVVWLVSGATNNTDVNPLTFGTSSGNSNNVAVMAIGWGTNSNTISVPLVTINAPGAKVSATNPSPGRYAYWVSDEGVKAKVTLLETNLVNKLITTPGMVVSSLVHLMGAAPPYLPSVMTNYGGINITTDIRTNPKLPLLTTLSGIQYADPSYAGITNNAMAADLTIWSYGVLCDVRRGGLKQDLTAAFEANFANSNNFNSLLLRSGSQSGNLKDGELQMAYSARANGLPSNLYSIIKSTLPSTSAYIDGLRWNSLFNYYNLYKANMATSPICTTTPSGQSPKGIGVFTLNSSNSVQARNPQWNDGGLPMSYGALNPSLIAESLVTKLSVKQLGTNYYFQVSYYPYAIYYNPYSVALDVSSSSFSISKSIACVNGGVQMNLTFGTNKAYDPYKLVTNANLWPYSAIIGSTTATNLPCILAGYFKMIATNNNPDRLNPGEIRVYSLTGLNTNIISANLDNQCQFIDKTNLLVSSPNITVGDGFGGRSITLTNFSGILPADLTGSITLTYFGRSGIDYNSAAFASTLISYWPQANFNFNNLPGYLPGSGTAGSFYNTANPKFSYPIGVLSTDPTIISSNPIVLNVTERIKGILPARSYTNYIGFGTNIPVFMGNAVSLNGDKSQAGRLGSYCPTIETDTNLSTLASNISIIPSKVNTNSSTVSWFNYPVGDALPESSKVRSNNVVGILRDVPISPMTSLGQFMHVDDLYNEGTSYMFPNQVPGMSIGGSFCCPETGPSVNAIFLNGNVGGSAQWMVQLDNSYLANEALFDSYFFSTIPPTNGFSWSGVAGSGFEPFNYKLTSNGVATNQALPNFRHVFYRKNGTNPLVSDLQDESKASAGLLLDGAFNVNSTSIIAWKSLLTSLNGVQFRTYNATSGEFENRYVTNPILRFCSVGRYQQNEPWDGMRSLTDKQVSALAEEIVNQVRKRGPFLSMGDFLSRRMAPLSGNLTNNLYTMGALQSAIENTQRKGTYYDVNSNIRTNSVNVTPNVYVGIGSSQCFPATNSFTRLPINQIASNTAVGIPGYLMQQDLVQAFAPVMTVRSDTFMIRVYGEADRKTASTATNVIVEGKAWGEAVVQRVPDFVDQKDPALISGTNIPGVSSVLGDATPVYGRSGRIVSSLNEALGRRFRIVSFRWLNQSDL